MDVGLQQSVQGWLMSGIACMIEREWGLKKVKSKEIFLSFNAGVKESGYVRRGLIECGPWCVK
jgi:hypothetical protein